MSAIVTRAAIILAVCGIHASTQTAQMTCTIYDQSGASVRCMGVTVTNGGTGVSPSGATTSTGNYLVTARLPGNYRVTAQAPRFKQMSREPVVLEVDQIARIDFNLTVGQNQETIEVK